MKLEPFVVAEGLAVYCLGSGPPVLLMPAPHRYFLPGDGSADAMIDGLVSLGRKVISFDPPGGGRSSRPPRFGIEEMLSCADETLAACGIAEPVAAVGHSMSGLALLAFCLARPERIERLVLAGTGSGGRAHMGAPGSMSNRSHPAFFRLAALGILSLLWPRRGPEIRLLNLIESLSYVDRRHAVFLPHRWGDWLRPKLGRSEWHKVAVKLDYSARLAEIAVPTLVLCGDRDPQFPLSCSQELAAGIPGARLQVLEDCGHYPFREQPAAFWGEIGRFLAAADYCATTGKETIR